MYIELEYNVLNEIFIFEIVYEKGWFYFKFF